MNKLYLSLLLGMVMILASCTQQKSKQPEVVALWLFDEQVGFYPSHVLEDQSENNIPLVLGLGGQIVEGKFGNALEPISQEKIKLPEGEVEFGLEKMSVPDGRTVEPLSWYNANYAAFMTSGENHLRKEIGFRKPTETDLNLGDFDWTIEFWFFPNRQTDEKGVLFELGTGPRGENDLVTSLSLDPDLKNFVLSNQPSGTNIKITTDLSMDSWQHVAVSYASANKKLYHFVNGKKISESENVVLKQLETGEEDYMSIGRDGLGQFPFQGKIDELRFVKNQIHTSEFQVPGTFRTGMKSEELVKGPDQIFVNTKQPVNLGSRKHLFIDDALIEKMQDVEFVVNPPRKEEVILTNIKGQFRKHLTIVEDEDGLIRIYNSAQSDYLQVHVSKDGIHFTAPDLGREYRGKKNFCILEPVGGLGNPFIDPNGKGDTRWKYITGYHSRGTYLFTSPDGYNWTRMKTALIPFRNGTQSCTFYDDQRQMYVSYHRTGIHHTPGLATERASVMTQTDNLFTPIKYTPLSQKDYWALEKVKRIRQPLPWWLDNGPLTPGDWGLEFPVKFQPDPADPEGTDLYITKAIKYPWAPDTYFAFPIVYFHYYQDGPVTRQELENPKRERGSGPIETQIAVSRNGLDWKRMYRPAYVGIGEHGGLDMKTAYIGQGMVKRGNEIWQYYFGEPHYHSAHKKQDDKRAVFRLVQRVDGFISIDSPYDKEAYITTKSFVFKGSKLILNIDTDATGYAQVGFLDENGNAIPGYSLDDCIYINGDFVDTQVEWMKNRAEITRISSFNEEDPETLAQKVITESDVSALQGKTVRLVFRLRGSKLYSMQFVK
jgi:hypothetical protein